VVVRIRLPLDSGNHLSPEVSHGFPRTRQVRYAARSFQPHSVEQDKLDRILEPVRLAPSGSNEQPWRFVVVRDAEIRRQLVAACFDQQVLAQAPVVIAGSG